MADGIDEHLPCAVLSGYIATETGADSIIEFEPFSVSVGRELVEWDSLVEFEGLPGLHWRGGGLHECFFSNVKFGCIRRLVIRNIPVNQVCRVGEVEERVSKVHMICTIRLELVEDCATLTVG